MRKCVYLLLSVILFVSAMCLAFEERQRGTPRPIITVGESLLVARAGLDSEHLAGLGVNADGKWALRIWDKSGTLKVEHDSVPSPPGRFPALAWAPDGRQLALAAGSEVWLFSPEEGSKKVLHSQPRVRQLEYEGQTLVARSDDRLSVWSQGLNKRPWVIKASHLIQATLDSSGTFLGVVTFDGGLRIYHVPSKRQIQHLEPGQTAVSPVFSRKGEYISYGLRNRADRNSDRFLTYSLTKNRQVGSPVTAPQLQGLAVDTDGKTVLVTGATHTVHDIENGRLTLEIPYGSAYVSPLSPDGTRALIAPENQTGAYLWTCSGKPGKPLKVADGNVSDLSFTSDDKHFVVVSGGRATLWEVR